MMTQLQRDLFDGSDLRRPAHPLIHNGTSTSVAAAEANEPRRDNQRERLFSAIRRATEGLTRQEAADETGMKLQSACARASELLGKRGYPVRIRETGLTRDGGKILVAT